MKTLFLVTIGTMVFGATSFAQTDTTRTGLRPTTQQTLPGQQALPSQQPLPTQQPIPGQQTQPTQSTQPVQPMQPQYSQPQTQPLTQPQTQPQGVTTPQTNPQSNPQTNPQTKPQTNQNTTTGWSPVNNQAIPDNLRQTLNSTPQYQGWESGSMYQNSANGTYQLKTNNLNNPQVYYFDKDGKIVTSPPHE